MNERLSRRLRSTYDAIRPVACHPDSYERLWRCYQKAYVADDALLAAVGVDARVSDINGVTEPLSVADIERALCMPQTISLEVGPADAPLGFVIVRYATRDQRSKQSFRDYFYSEALDGTAPQFVSSQAQRTLEEALDLGNIMCSVEFVASANSTVAAALLIATYKWVAIERMKTENAFVVGKCLDRVQIGSLTNERGNVGIKALAEGVHMQKIGWITQERRLANGAAAQLRFAIYLGDCMRVRSNAMRWGIPLGVEHDRAIFVG
jgi:hypothetical protein